MQLISGGSCKNIFLETFVASFEILKFFAACCCRNREEVAKLLKCVLEKHW